MDAATMDTPTPARRTPPVLELIEPPRGFGIGIDVLEALIKAADDRAEYAGDDERALLRRGAAALEREAARILASF